MKLESSALSKNRRLEWIGAKGLAWFQNYDNLFQPIMSLDCGPGPLSSADWNLTNSLLVAVAVRSDVTVWDLSKMSPVSKTYLRQVTFALEIA